MNTVINELAETLRSTRRSASRMGRRLTRKARIKFGVTISLPPFLRIVFDYSADLGAPANDNRKRSRTA